MREYLFSSFLACIFVVVVRVTSWSAENSRDDDNGTQGHPTVKGLIAELANKNGPPKQEGSKGYPIWPNDYDWSEQTRIRKVWKELHSCAGEGLSELVKHLADDRYCLTMAGPSGAYNNHTVGWVCRYILRANIEPFERPTMNHFAKFMPQDDEKIREWWNSRGSDSLLELQLESIDNARKSKLEYLARTEDATKQKRFRDDVAHLDKLTEQIRTTEKPIRLDAIGREEFRFAAPEKKKQ